jgi:hypothetical protein
MSGVSRHNSQHVERAAEVASPPDARIWVVAPFAHTDRPKKDEERAPISGRDIVVTALHRLAKCRLPPAYR